MDCIYCQNKTTYLLSDGIRKCSQCRRKFSPKKIAREKVLIGLFLSASKIPVTALGDKPGININTIKKHFMIIRKKIALFLDKEFERNIAKIDEYDEHIYCQKNSKSTKNCRFISFSFEDKIYTLLLQENIEQKNRLENFYKMIKVKKDSSTITDFWNYFKVFIAKHRGVARENLIYYIKEAEFRYNYSKEEQKEILDNIL
jgi:transposase